MVTSRECRERAAECREMAECEPNAHVRAVLNDMARGWKRLATWLSWKSDSTKSDNLKKVRQRTDQLIQRQEVLKQLQEDGQVKESRQVHS